MVKPRLALVGVEQRRGAVCIRLTRSFYWNWIPQCRWQHVLAGRVLCKLLKNVRWTGATNRTPVSDKISEKEKQEKISMAVSFFSSCIYLSLCAVE